MYEYHVIDTLIPGPDGLGRTSYGLELWQYEADTRRRLTTIPDISLQKPPLLLLAIRCTAMQLDPIHLWDILEDFFSL